MSIEKCLEFLETQELNFERFDHFDDKTEGHSLYQLAKKVGVKIENSEDGRFKLNPKKRNKVLFGSCWYNGIEDLSMWDRYRSDRGIAVSIKKVDLIRCFSLLNKELVRIIPNEVEDLTIGQKYHGDMVYFSANTQKEKNTKVGLLKHSAFEHEKEYRLILRLKNDSGLVERAKWRISDFDECIWTLYTNPYMGSNFEEMIKSYIHKLDLTNVIVRRSKFRNLFE